MDGGVGGWVGGWTYGVGCLVVDGGGNDAFLDRLGAGHGLEGACWREWVVGWVG